MQPQTIEAAQHDILLVIAAALFILFVTALAFPLRTPITPIIIPPG